MPEKKKLVSIVMPCFNEEDNVQEACRRIKEVFAGLPQYDYEHIFMDNASTDRTVPFLREIAAQDKRVKVIVNARNFGHIRSPFHGYLHAKGDAVIAIVSDLQDPPEVIPQFLEKWEQGYKIVVGVKKGGGGALPLRMFRKLYYAVLGHLAEVELIRNFHGFGLYDRKVVDIFRETGGPYPYMRGLICEIGFERAEIEYVPPMRKHGITKNNFYSLYDNAMLGMTSHSKIPLRLATFTGFCLAAISLLVAAVYFVYKLIFWYRFEVGIAPLVIGIFFFTAVQLFFTGILGEYIGAIHTQVVNRPLVIEKERINFDD